MKIITNPKQIDFEKLESFVSNHPQANFFQSTKAYVFFNSLENYQPVLMVVQKNEEIIGSLLSVIIKEGKGIKGYFSRRCIAWGGPLIKDNDLVIMNELLKEYNETIKKNSIYSQFRNFWSWTDKEKKICKKNGYFFEEHLDIIHDLSISQENQCKLLHQTRRKNIRKSEKKKLVFIEVVTEKDIRKCFLIIKDTYKKVGLPLPDVSFFLKSNLILGKEKIMRTFAAQWNGHIIGTRMVLCYNQLIYDWYAGADSTHLDKFPNDFLPWKIMVWGSKHGFKKFDFGGAGIPNKEYGVRDYKLKFGGQLVEFGRFENIFQPILYRLGKFGLKFYKKIT